MEGSTPTLPSRIPPAADQIEINVFGPGVGECVLVHLGAGNWLMVDSCRGRGREKPAALEYLTNLGEPAGAIKVIVASHWHDDHVRGISEVYRAAPRADFYIGGAVSVDEFRAVTSSTPDRVSRFTSGVDELATVARLADERGVPVKTVSAAQRLLYSPDALVSEIWTLSPSYEEMNISRRRIATLLGDYAPGARRIPAQSSNDSSVVLYLETKMGPVLLGGDLEHRGDRLRGWYAVLDLEGAPTGRATCFKVPHHGSINAHCPEVWDQRLEPNALAAVTPFDRGRSSLPRESDRNRIRGLTTRGFLTSDKRDRVQPLDRITQKTVREVTREFSAQSLLMGHVQFRADSLGWAVAASPEVVAI